MPVAAFEEVHKVYGTRRILAGASMAVEEGERVGLVGANGCGKSTLARILAGIEDADSGRVVCRRDARILYLAQDPELPAGVSARDVVVEGLEAWRTARARYDDVSARIERHDGDATELAHEQAEAADELVRAGGWERLHEAEAVLDHLGIADPAACVDTMSGGQRRRVALARVLVAEPALAILDEPTNHLDIPTIEWLEEFLVRRFAGAVLVVTHDREFLDNVVMRTLEIEAGTVESYAGGYEAYLQAKADRAAHDARVDANRRNYLRAEMEWLRRGPKARGTKQKARIRRAEDALAEAAASGSGRKAMAAIDPGTVRSGKTVLETHGLGLERGGRRLISGLDLALAAGERLGVVGPNGSGKTTLLKTLCGEFEPTDGRVVVGRNTRVAYLDQARSDLDPAATIFENVIGDRGVVRVGEREVEPAQYLERFLFDRAAQRRTVEELSGGERARVALAKLLASPANLLLLDEPTNDLDVDTLAALEAMLADYPGSVVIVTHDRRLLDRVALRTLLLDGAGSATVYAGGYADAQSQRRAAGDIGTSAGASATESKQQKQPKGGERPRRRAPLSYAERQELEGIMERIEAAEADVARIEGLLADPSSYAGGDEVARLAAELGTARAHAEALVARWEELEMKKDPGSASPAAPRTER